MVKGQLAKPRPRRPVTLAYECWITQASLAKLLRRGDSEVRRWLERREAKRERTPFGVHWLVNDVLVDALDEWGYDVRLGGACRVCGCTEDDCSGCIERTGEPCYWVEADPCSACEDAPVEVL